MSRFAFIYFEIQELVVQLRYVSVWNKTNTPIIAEKYISEIFFVENYGKHE